MQRINAAHRVSSFASNMPEESEHTRMSVLRWKA